MLSIRPATRGPKTAAVNRRQISVSGFSLHLERKFLAPNINANMAANSADIDDTVIVLLVALKLIV